MTRAPGKIMIAGEYSVLLGKPAIVAAIDRFAYCHFAPGLNYRFVKNTTGTLTEDDTSPLFAAVYSACKMHGFAPQKGTYTLDTSEFFADGKKIGLGSSAAGITALVQTILQQHTLPPKMLTFTLSYLAHRQFTGGGSGADCAASAYGEVIRYSQHPLIEPVRIPKDHLLVVSTNIPQSTVVFVEKFLQHAQSEYIIDFAEKSEAIVNTITNNQKSEVYQNAFQESADLLDDLGRYLGIPIVSPEHKIIVDIAARCDGAAKPSGAGGGDVAVAFIPPAQHAQFSLMLKHYNFAVVPLNFL